MLTSLGATVARTYLLQPSDHGLLAYGDLCDGNAVAFSRDGRLLALAGATVDGRRAVAG
jgi:hypothetical protein